MKVRTATQKNKRLWRVQQGKSETRVRADTHAEAKSRAASYGFKKPDSVVLIEEAKKNPRGGDHISLAELKTHARGFGMTVRLKDGEYRVAFPGDEASAYYTNDAQDALGTMKLMYQHSQGITVAKKNPRRSFGKKRTLKSAVRKIREHVPQRYVICAKVGGTKYFFNGRGFDSVGAHAATYINRAFAASVSRSIRGMLPHKIKSLVVEPL